MKKLSKTLRKIRINNDETLYDMAKKLKISPAYLSSIENGNRKIPEDFFPKLKSKYNLDQKEINEVNEGIIENTITLKINMSNFDLNKRNYIYSLTRTFDDMSCDDIKEMLKYATRKKDDMEK